MLSSFQKKRTIVVVSLITLSLLVGVACRGAASGKKFGTFREDGRLVFFDDAGAVRVAIVIELAATPAEKRKGLMGRHKMDDTVGMLFVYDRAADRVFWMRNTSISLDILFISEDRKVINIASHTVPDTEKRYRSTAPAMYVVEVVSGFCERYGIKQGTHLNWQLMEVLR